MAVRLLAAPAAEPVTLAELKAHLRIESDAENTVLTTLIVAARAAIERQAGRLMLTQSWRVTLDRVPPTGVIALPLSPVQTVSAVRVADASGTFATWPGASLIVDLVSDPGRLMFIGVQPMPGIAMGGIEIDVVAGYGATVAAVPAPLVQAVKLLAAHWYETRGDGPAAAMPADVAALVAGFRKLRLVA